MRADDEKLAINELGPYLNGYHVTRQQLNMTQTRNRTKARRPLFQWHVWAPQVEMED